MEIAKPRLWTRNFIILSLASLFIGLIFYLTVTTITVYVTEEFNASESKAGLASSIMVIGTLSARLLTGKYIEIIGRRKLLYTGVFLTFLITLLLFTVNHLNTLIILRLIQGFMMGMALTVLQTTVVDVIPVERRGEGISYYSLSFVISTAAGPFLGALIIQYATLQILFAVCAIFALTSAILTLFASIPTVNITTQQLNEMKSFRMKEFFELRAVPISIVMGILAFAYSGILSFLTTYTIEINLIAASSFFFIVYSISVLVSRPFTGKILDVKGANIVIYPTVLLFAIGLFVVSQAEHGITLLVAGALIGLGYGNLQSANQAIAIKESPPHRVGLATSTFFICLEVGIGFGPFLLGYFIPIIGYRHMYLTLGVIVLLSIFAYYILHGKKQAIDISKQKSSHASL